MQTGFISVQTENIFPIIKQFLYSDQEIFLRELVSNAVDATTKLKAIAARGEMDTELGDTHIEILLDAEAKTLTIRDRGIGMSADEVTRYLNQVAFSSAQEFLEKYKGEGIIGHFGLGFYSAFMVSQRVEVCTQSYRSGEGAVRWSCDGTPAYTIAPDTRPFRGTDIILHISDDCTEYLDNTRIQALLDKYCKFLPVEIQFGTRTERTYEGEGDNEKEIATEVANVINNTTPLWKKTPTELSDDDYRNFYNELFPYSTPPLFWIHLNIDYPFNLTGVLYFPKLTNNVENQRNKISLYSNQVYVTDEVKEIVPEFLTLLHGVIDSPDIPLNVSRSYLQSDKNVKQITNYITKKVADRLAELFKNDRPQFEEKWENIGVFVKYGILADEKFAERALKFALLNTLDNKAYTLDEYKELVAPTQTDKNNKLVCLYTNAPNEHHHYIQLAQQAGYSVLRMDGMLDPHFMQKLEQAPNANLTFVRVDSNTLDKLIEKDTQRESILTSDEQQQIENLFKPILPTTEAHLQMQALSPEEPPVTIVKPEFLRRWREMSLLNGMDMSMMPDSYTVVVNTNHPIVAQKILTAPQPAHLAKHLYHLALLQQGMLKGAQLTEFVQHTISTL